MASASWWMMPGHDDFGGMGEVVEAGSGMSRKQI